MKFKEMLENYMNYKARIKAIEYDIKKIELKEISIGSPNLEVNGDLRPKGFISSNIELKVINKIDEIKLLQKQKEELEAQVEMIDSLINTLSDYHRQIIDLKYKYNKSEQQIGIIVYRGKRAINKQLKIALALLEGKYEEFLKSSQKVPN